MAVKQISIFVENRKGTMLEITKTMADAEIDIRALSIADTTDYGILRLIVNDPEKAIVTVKNAGFTASVTEVIAILIEDKPGGFSRPVEILTNNDINLEYAYAFITPIVGDAYVIIRVEDNDKAEKILAENGVRMLTQEQIEKL